MSAEATGAAYAFVNTSGLAAGIESNSTYDKPSGQSVDDGARFWGVTPAQVEAAGDFHIPQSGWRKWLAGLASGDVKGAAWRAMQDAGGVYGRMINAGPMLYVVGRRD